MSSNQNVQELKPKAELPSRFKWDHRHPFHRTMVKIFNQFMALIPFSIKYGIGKMRRKNRFPYSLIKPGDTVVQIGAPSDTLRSGRSRGMYFSLFAGPTGKVVIVEPDSASKTAFAKIAKDQNINNIVFHHSGAWNEKKDLKIYIDPKHPATNFTEGQVEWDDERMKDFKEIIVPANTVDNILDMNSLSNVKLVSITTNGAETAIIQGMKNTIGKGLPYISLALTDDYEDLMESINYKFYTYDDRGQTFVPA